MIRLRRWILGSRDERAVETTAMILVLPFLVVMVLALVDVGLMFQARMNVTNVARDLVRNMAAEGGNRNPRTTTLPAGVSWTDIARKQLVHGGVCVFGKCNGTPTITCGASDGSSSYSAEVIRQAGDTITCEIAYPYVGVNPGLLNSPMGLGFGTLIKPFTVSASARSETGTLG